MGKSKRKYIRSLPISGEFENVKGIVYLVYSYRSDKLTSGPPYRDRGVAISEMSKHLSEGVCSWIVSYDA